MPGVRALEDRLLSELKAWGEPSPLFFEELEALTQNLFAASISDTRFVWPENRENLSEEETYDIEDDEIAFDESFKTKEMAWAEDIADYLKTLGWDLSDDRDNPLQLTKYVGSVIEGVAKGMFGKSPDSEVVDLQNWSEKLEREAGIFKSKQRNSK
jgi:hypothetical protein